MVNDSRDGIESARRPCVLADARYWYRYRKNSTANVPHNKTTGCFTARSVPPPQAQWVPSLLHPPAHTKMNYVVTDLEGGPQPPMPVEDSYRKTTLAVSRAVGGSVVLSYSRRANAA